ncbi:uncharacterized protein LOC107045096 [Diachasma alloeum]|uniref:uncharacterized protein LOC107045096 n=1 Tax=Diachasma alloeum TaxID=454923 RepID=UPI0007384A36|nr:uncharacterized protein LOC107045096 [Diachasma alloeum]
MPGEGEKSEQQSSKVVAKGNNMNNTATQESPAPIQQAMSTTIGTLPEFNSTKYKWEEYLERCGYFFNANKITEEDMKKNTLQMAVGSKSFDIIKNLMAPEQLKDAIYTSITEKCNKAFCKPVNELLARVRFQKRDQKAGETLDNFVTALRKLAADCKFGGDKESLPLSVMLRDRFVTGLADHELQRYLCRRHEEYVSPTNKIGITIDRALEIARSIEGTENQQKMLKNAEAPANATCKFCQKTGHIESACFGKKSAEKNKKKSSTHHTTQVDSDSDKATVYAARSSNIYHTSRAEFKIKVKINNIKVDMEIHNGADETLINISPFNKIWKDTEPQWTKHQSNLRAWRNRPIKTKGTAIVDVQYKGIKKKLPLVITDEDKGPNLFGNNWFEPFGIKITGIQQVEAKTEYQQLLEEYPGLLKKELSGHKGTPIHIELKKDSSPKFFKA